MRKKLKQLIGILLTLVMVLGQMPGISLTAYATGEKAYAAYDVTTETNKSKSGEDLTALQVTFNDRKWYIIEDKSSSATSGTVTLLSADTTFGTKTFDAERYSNKYSTSQVKAYLDSMTGTDGDFADVAGAIETVNMRTNQYNSTAEYETVNGVKLYLLSTEEANSLPENVLKAGFTEGDCYANQWWLRSPGGNADGAAFVYGDFGYVYGNGYIVEFAFGVRPALQLNLESVIFESNTFRLKPSHTHSFSYSVGTGTESNTVTATCTEGCTDNYNTTGIKLTLSAPENLTYDGNAKAASLSGYPQTTVENLAAQPTIQYFKTNEQGSTTASGDAIESAINAGYYVAQITWGDQEVKVPFTIAKAAGSISFSSASETKSIGAENFTKTVTNTGDGTVNYSSDKATVATVDGTSGEVTIVGAGEATITATVVDGTNYSYETKTASYTLTVNKADVSVTAPTAVTGLTYNGNEQTLIGAGSTEDGTIVYSLN